MAKHVGDSAFVSDAGKLKPRFQQELDEAGIVYEQEGHTESKVLAADVVVKSPGIPDKAALVQKVSQKGIPVISEIEYGYEHLSGKVIGITGSNGKTTTTALTHHILKKAGMDVALTGNIGKSLARQVATDPKAYYVVEVSSFQLDGILTFRPHISILTNITPDHLDRYDNDFSKYIRAKFNITRNQEATDHFIYNLDDEATMKHLESHFTAARRWPFSLEQEVEQGAYISNNELIINTYKNQFTMSINELALKGKHNQSNSMAAGVAARILDIRKDMLRESMSDFESLPHRLEKVAKISGVEFINDSKATNVNSTWYALESMDRPVIWIAGGVDKGNDYECMQELVSKRVKAIVCLGVDNRRIHEAFGKRVDVLVNTSAMKEAVRMAMHLADKEDIVLLSPACASFDLFENYEDRGNQFKEAVRDL